MRARNHHRWGMIFPFLVVWACSDAPPAMQSGSEDPSQSDGPDDSAGGDDEQDVDTGTSSNPERRDAAVDAARSPQGAGALVDAAKPGPTPGTRGDGSTTSAIDDAGEDSTTDAANSDSGGTTPPGDLPAAVVEPMIWGFGLGVTDLVGAVKFYTEVMKMTVEKENVRRDDRTETILYASQGKRGARIVLMKFDDMRNTRKITTKLVFQAQNTRAVNSAAMMHPDYESRLNIGIVQFDGPETYIHEVGSIFDSGSGVSVPYPLAMGFATSDLAASRRFYVAIGMSESRLGSFSVSDATGSGMIEEYTVKFVSGSGAVLQKWTPMRNAKDNPIKLVMMVPDAKAIADKVVAAGGKVVKDAERLPIYDNRQVIVTKDIDGYLLEFVQ
jgi:predicted enzyme related to lactoylglutathione lyase